VIDVAGSPSYMGKTLGRSCQSITSTMLRDAHLPLGEKGMSWSDATASVRQYRVCREGYFTSTPDDLSACPIQCLQLNAFVLQEVILALGKIFQPT